MVYHHFPYVNSHFGAIFRQTQPCCAVPKFTPQPILQPLGAAGLFMPCPKGRSRRVAPGWLWWRLLRAAGCHDVWRGRRPSDWKRTQTLGRSLGFGIEGSGFTKHVFWYVLMDFEVNKMIKMISLSFQATISMNDPYIFATPLNRCCLGSLQCVVFWSGFTCLGPGEGFTAEQYCCRYHW
jgi:hypothetical protein